MRIAFRRAAIAVASAVMLLATSTAAHAADDADGTAGDADQAPAPVIKADDHQSSITITKYKKIAANGTTPGQGNELNPPPQGEPLAGVTFTLNKVTAIGAGEGKTDVSTLDMTTNEAFQTLAPLMNDVRGHIVTTGDGQNVFVDAASITSTPDQTGDDGKVTFSNLDYGVYLVQETKFPAGATPSAPFLVLLPFPTTLPDGSNGFVYNVNAYPKNSIDTISKTVDTTNLTKDQTVTYTLKSTVHPYADGLTKYVLRDDMDSRLQVATNDQDKYDTIKVYVTNDRDAAQPSDDDLAVEGTDYTVTTTPGQGDNAKMQLLITFLPAGLSKLDKVATVDNGGVVVHITAKVVLGADDAAPNTADLTNTAWVFPNQDSNWPDPNVPDPNNPGDGKTPPPSNGDNPPTIKFGEIDVTKVDPNQTDATDSSKPKALAGARFQLKDSAGNVVTFFDPTTNAYVTEVTTGADGIAKLGGLPLSNWVDGAQQTENSDHKQYQLIELEAPDGYTRLNKPIMVDLDAATKAITVENVSKSAFNLPSTGGSGVLLTTAAGAVLVGLAGVTFAVRRKK